jgi:hypothetical protein
MDNKFEIYSCGKNYDVTFLLNINVWVQKLSEIS